MELYYLGYIIGATLLLGTENPWLQAAGLVALVASGIGVSLSVCAAGHPESE